MADFTGMFNFGAPQGPSAQQAMQMAQMSPQQQVAYSRIRGGQMLGEGAGNALRLGVGAATGADVRTPQERAATVKQQLLKLLQERGIDPSDQEQVYPILIKLLYDNGMVAEAMQAAQQFEAIKGKAFDRDIKEREVKRKEDADKARAEMYRERTQVMQDKNASTEKLLEQYAKTAEQLESGDYESAADKARLQALLRGLGARLGVKPEKKDGVWRVTVTPSTKHAKGMIVKYHTVTGETSTEELNNRVEAPAGGGGADGVDAGPNGKPTPHPNAVDAEGRQIHVDKNGQQWVMDGSGGWEKPDSNARDTRDRALPDAQRKAVTDLEVVIDQVDNILELMNSPAAKRYVGIKAYANKFMDFADRVQADGVPLRARITDLGSFVLHARSGAAVTAQEFDRLRGFIPQASDAIKAARNKLTSMKAVAISRANAIRRTFNNPEKTYGATPSATAAPAQTPRGKVVDFGSLK